MQELSVRIGAARRAMIHVLGLVPSDRVFVVTDQATRRVGDAFRAAALAHGCATVVYELPEDQRPLQEIPAGLATLLDDTSVVVNALAGRSDETPFRLAWLKRIEATGRARCGHCPGITEAMLDAGPLAVDYARMQERGERLIAALTGADCVLVIDGSMGVFGVAPAPLRIDVREGRIAGLACDDTRFLEEVRRLTALDAEASVIGELGIGINPGARIVGRMLEDEKALRTAHIAFGNNEDFGGRNSSRAHLDFLFHRPTIEAIFPDQRRRVVMREGNPS